MSESENQWITNIPTSATSTQVEPQMSPPRNGTVDPQRTPTRTNAADRSTSEKSTDHEITLCESNIAQYKKDIENLHPVINLCTSITHDYVASVVKSKT